MTFWFDCVFQSFSRLQEESSLIHGFTDGQFTLFQCLAKRRLACIRQGLTSFHEVSRPKLLKFCQEYRPLGTSNVFMDHLWYCVSYFLPKTLNVPTRAKAVNKGPFFYFSFYTVVWNIMVKFIEFFRSYVYSHTPIMLVQFKSNINRVCAWRKAFSHSCSVIYVRRSSIHASLSEYIYSLFTLL